LKEGRTNDSRVGCGPFGVSFDRRMPCGFNQVRAIG
jgi:hypothetical protein